MPDLNLGPTPQSSPHKSLLAATVVLAVAAACVFYFNPRKTAELKVTNLALYSVQTSPTIQQSGNRVIGQAQETDNDLYVVATLHIENKLRLPIYIDSIDATFTPPDGTPIDEKALVPSDTKRIEEIFPALAPLTTNPLTFDPGIAPQSSIDGAILLHFPGLTEATWKARKSATLTINLAHQNPQTITIAQ